MESATSEVGEGSLVAPKVTPSTEHVVTTVSDAEDVTEPNLDI